MSISLFIKQFISFFVEPFGFFVAFFSFGLYFLLKEKIFLSKVLLVSSFIILFIFSYPPFANKLLEVLENKYPKYSFTSKVEYIHVLGNGHNGDNNQPISSRLSDAGTKRVLEGILIHQKIPSTKIIFTGYNGNFTVSTAEMNARFAKELGVKNSDIILGIKAQDTQEEALFTKNILGTSPFILVTSAAHMPRAMYLFESLGMHPIAAPTDFKSSNYSKIFMAPSANALQLSQQAMHEYIGRLWAIIRIQLHRLKVELQKIAY